MGWKSPVAFERKAALREHLTETKPAQLAGLAFKRFHICLTTQIGQTLHHAKGTFGWLVTALATASNFSINEQTTAYGERRLSRRPLTMMALGEVNMSGASMFDKRMLEAAFSEIEAVRQSLPATTLSALAHEVVKRVARNLALPSIPEVQPRARDIDALCDALLSDTPGAAAAFVENARLSGASYETLCLIYLSGAAQRLGQWWDEDRIPFQRVTIAAGRIYAILRILRLKRPETAPDTRRAAVFATLPDENHTLGITIATDLARERGWDIELFTGLSNDDLVEKLEQRQPALIGLSASGKRMLPALTRLLVALRISNPGSKIMIAGQIASSGLSLVGVLGADAAAAYFDDALNQMDRLLGLPTPRLN